MLTVSLFPALCTISCELQVTNPMTRVNDSIQASEVHRIQPWQEIESKFLVSSDVPTLNVAESNHAQRSNTYTNTLIALLTHILNYQDPWLLYLCVDFLETDLCNQD